MPDLISSAAFEFTLQVERLYAALTAFADAAEPGTTGDPNLGGKLIYAGELEPHGRALLVAGNIAGAASLAVTADLAAQKQAIRDGVADFLVNSLDEALRILKNEIRKREAVAVCIAAAPQAVENEMLERGVLPDLLAPLSPPIVELFGKGVRHIELTETPGSRVLVTWTVAAAPAQWLPKLDGIALECIKPADGAARRWLRLAPRYLGRRSQGLRVLHCEPDVAREFVARVQNAVERGQIAVEVRIGWNRDEEVFVFQPSSGPAS
jgi:urocanate hydratase